MAELTQLGEIDPAAREGLMSDLRNTDPKLWPQVVQQFKAVVAYRRQAAQRAMLAQGGSSPQDAVNGPNRSGVIATGYAAQAGATPAAPTTQNAAWQTTSQTSSQKNTAALPSGTPPQAVPPIPSGQPLNASQEKTDATAPTPTQSETQPATATNATSPLPTQTTPAKPPAPQPSAEAAETPSQAASPSSGDWHAPLAAAIGAMETELERKPEDSEALQRQTQLRLLCLVAGRREDALKSLSAGTPAQREFWTKQVYGLDTWLDTARTPDATRRAADTKRLLDEASMRLGESAALCVRNMALCTDIQSYGCYKTFKTDEFQPEQEVLLYAEVENFTSEGSAKGFHTALRSSYQIFDTRGERVADHEFTVTEEHCQNPRRDFFIGYHMRLPKRLNPGKYTLKLTIEDLKSQKVGQSSIDFSIRESAR